MPVCCPHRKQTGDTLEPVNPMSVLGRNKNRERCDGRTFFCDSLILSSGAVVKELLGSG